MYGLLATSVMNGIRHHLLHLLGQRLLQSQWNLAVSNGVADLASLLVGARVVDGIWEFVL